MNNIELDEEHHKLMTDREYEYPEDEDGDDDEDEESICPECNGEGEDLLGWGCRGCRGSGFT